MDDAKTHWFDFKWIRRFFKREPQVSHEVTSKTKLMVLVRFGRIER